MGQMNKRNDYITLAISGKSSENHINKKTLSASKAAMFQQGYPSLRACLKTNLGISQSTQSQRSSCK